MKTILVVDDNKLNLATARKVLSNEYRVIPVMKGQQALSYLEGGECDIVLLDINMPEMDGFEVLAKMHEREEWAGIPVIFLTADTDAETEIRCFKEGAVDFIAKPFVPEVMLSRIGRTLELEELRRSLADRLEQKTKEVTAIKSKSQHDVLTGLWNRAYTEETVNRILERGIPGALLMIDIDNFKSVNDSYGHIAGDELLKKLADTLRHHSTEEDVICRIGGDEFVVFVHNVTLKAELRERATNIIAELHHIIEELGFECGTSVSIGIAQASGDGAEFSRLYNSADKALYYVKRNGKDSYHFFSDKLSDDDNLDDKADLKYLQELMHRTDGGKGAYLLDVESFQRVYNFIRRFTDRTKRDVSMLLFTLGEDESAAAMDLLEKTVCSYLRRSDVTTRYSDKQLIVILMDANSENGAMVAERVMENFNKSCEAPAHIDYDIARMDNQLIPEAPESL